MGLWLDLNWYELSSLGIVRSDKDTALQNWFLSQRSEIVGLNRSGIICTGQCCALGDAGGRQIKPFKRWPSLGESLIEPFFWFGSEREHLLYLQYIHSDSTNKELQRLIICVTHSLSHRPQIAGLSNKPGVPSWWISYRVVLLFMCALCRLFLFCTSLVDQLGWACVHLQCWFCPHTRTYKIQGSWSIICTPWKRCGGGLL